MQIFFWKLFNVPCFLGYFVLGDRGWSPLLQSKTNDRLHRSFGNVITEMSCLLFALLCVFFFPRNFLSKVNFVMQNKNVQMNI